MLNKFRRIVKGIKLNVELIKGIASDDNSLFIKSEEITPEGYVIRHNTLSLMNNNIAIAGCTVTKIGFRQVPFIITDNIFNKMSKETQEFIIQHELGHFNLHKHMLISGFERNDQMEFEADAYSANIVGYENAIRALEELKETLDLLGFGKNKECTEEIERRIMKIKDHH